MKLKRFNFLDFESDSILTQKTWLIILMAIFVFMIYNLLIAFSTILFSVFYAMFNSGSPKAFLNPDAVRLCALFATAMGILSAIVYVKFAEKRPLSTIGLTKKNILPQFGLGALIGIVMIGIPALILFLFDGNVSLNPQVSRGLLFLYLLGFLVQGAAIEFLIRGYLFTSLCKSSNIVWAVAISSLFFALLHLLCPEMGVLPFINIFIFGVFACFLFLRTKNIWAIAALHGIWSFFQGNIFGIQISGQIYREKVFNMNSALPDLLSGGDFGLEGGLLVTVVLVAAILLTVFCGKGKLVIKGEKIETK